MRKENFDLYRGRLKKLDMFSYNVILRYVKKAMRFRNFFTRKRCGLAFQNTKNVKGNARQSRAGNVYVDRPYVTANGEYADYTNLPDWMKQSIVEVQTACQRMP